MERSDSRADEVVIRQSLDGTGKLKRAKNGKEGVVTLRHQLATRWRTWYRA